MDNQRDQGQDSARVGAVTETPAEPFACPNCGQMLAPSCRVCVACREVVDFTKIRELPATVAGSGAPVPSAEAPFRGVASPGPQDVTVREPPAAMQFSWPIFFVCVAAYLLIGYGAEHLLKSRDLSWFVGGLLAACAVWVYFDATRRKIPHPLRWALGSFLIWIVVFPWYLSRRRKPALPCAIMEAPGRAFLRTVIWVLIFCAIVGLISAVMRRPPH